MIKPVTSFARARWEGIRASYWFIPVCMMFSAFLLGYTLIYYTPEVVSEAVFKNLIPPVPAEEASDLISAIATSIITATSIAFSMTLVALTMASSQFGPRLLQTFMDDRGTQCVLGILTSTFIFCLSALHRISVSDTDMVISSVLSLIVLAIGIADTLVLIYYIHHIARFIQVDEIINRCYRECTDNLKNLFALTDGEKGHHHLAPALINDSPVTTHLSLDEAGYIQTIDYLSLLSGDGIDGVKVYVRAGDYVVPGETIITVHSSEKLSSDSRDFYLSCFVPGKRRTSLQDPEFSLTQLVEVALRALSPGINDPITAMTCADRLTAVCLLMSECEFPCDTVMNSNVDVWMQRRTYTFESVLNTAFDQIRQAGSSHVDVMLHLLGCLKTLKEKLPEEYKGTIQKQVEAVNDLAAPHLHCEKDRKDVAAAVNAAATV